MSKNKPLLVLLILTVLVIVDVRRPPQRQWAAQLALLAINAWQSLSVHSVGRERCRYTPTCSVFGELAVRRYGAYRGGLMTLYRLLRCNPWSDGGVDWPNDRLAKDRVP